MAEPDSTSEPERKFDLVVFGASGFTGQYVVEELARVQDEEKDLTWAVAGRNLAKLVTVLKHAAEVTDKNLCAVEILIADVNDHDSLVTMCKQAKVILNCVGPYRFWGEQVVKACVDGGANYLDISGEPQFLEKTQLNYHSAAKEKGLYMVGSCGFDSIPADMGVIFTRDKFEGDLNSIESYFTVHSGPEGSAGHYATWQSAIHGFAHAKELGPLRKKLYPDPMPKSKHILKKRPPLHKSALTNRWCLPFPGSDRSVVMRTQRYMYHEENEKPVQFHCYVQVPSLLVALVTMMVGIVFGILAQFKFGRNLLEKYPRLFSAGVFSHEGPTKKQLETASFSFQMFGEGYSTKLDDPNQQHEEKPDKTIKVLVKGPEIGYVSTPICLVQAALVILKETEKLPEKGGVYPPGAAFAKTSLIQRLCDHNVKFEVVE